MNWLEAINKFFKVKNVYDNIGEVKKLSAFSKKLSQKKKLELSDLNIFADPTLAKANKNASTAVASAQKVLATTIVWPKRDTEKAYFKAFQMSSKHGHDSKKATDAMDEFARQTLLYGNAMSPIVVDLEKNKKLFDGKIKTAKALGQYARVLEGAFRKCAKIPSPFTTAGNAQFVTMAEQSMVLAGQYESLTSLLIKIRDKNAKAHAQGQQMKRDNDLWMVWAMDALPKGNTETLKKNRKAKTPKK